MKKLLSMILAFTIMLLASCGNGDLQTSETTEEADVGVSSIRPIFYSIESLLAASRGEGEPDNMSVLNSFEFPDYDKVVYPVCNVEGYYLIAASIWHWGYHYSFALNENYEGHIEVFVRMNVTSESSRSNFNDNYIHVPYEDGYYSIYFSDDYVGEKTKDVVTMVSVEIEK